MRIRWFYSMGLFVFAWVGCEKSPPTSSSKHSNEGEVKNTTSLNAKPEAIKPAAPAHTRSEASSMAMLDLKSATEGLGGSGALSADFETESGKFSCKLFEDKAPKTVANFVGLARGLQPFKDPMSAQIVKRPAYDGVKFHRIIKGFMIQTGDPTGTGMGDPGYVIPDEIWPGAKHDRAGLLCMANRGPNTNGMQFFITDDAAPHLDKGYTIFGECSPVEVIHKIADVPVQGDRPVSAPKIQKVTIRRG